MVFMYNNKKYDVDVKRTLESARIPEDIYPDSADDGVAIRDLCGFPEFSDCVAVCIFYNADTNEATVELCREDYTSIQADFSDEELKLLFDFFAG